MKLGNFDIIFLSYKEPNCDENWYELTRHIPWAKRVHGVKGYDAAHKACADLATTEMFITIDGDTKITDFSFIDHNINLEEYGKNPVISWPSKNSVNGLVYGNGSIKLWPKTRVYEQRTHEAADPNNPENSIEFCFAPYYYAETRCFSETVIHTSPEQAFKSAYREGVKMLLDRGSKVYDYSMLYPGNIKRFETWCSVGLDVENGIWSMLGARLGAYKLVCEGLEVNEINNIHEANDFSRLEKLFRKGSGYDIETMITYMDGLGDSITKLTNIKMKCLPSEYSTLFKRLL